MNAMPSSRRVLLAVCGLASLLLASCASTNAGLQDLGSSLGSGLGRNTDPNGTNTRPDVYGGFTRPTVPSIAGR